MFQSIYILLLNILSKKKLPEDETAKQAYDKIKKSISDCNNPRQLNTIKNMLDLYKQKYNGAMLHSELEKTFYSKVSELEESVIIN